MNRIERQIEETHRKIEMMGAPTAFYAVAHHGTAGLGDSYGYAEVYEGEVPRTDQTTTVAGPMTKDEAKRQVQEWNELCEDYRAEQIREEAAT